MTKHIPHRSGDKTIRVSDEVFEAMQAQAKPFKDTPDSVLRRILGLPPKLRDVRTRGPERLPEDHNSRCKAVTNSGKQCSFKAQTGIHFCGMHWTPERQKQSDWPPRVED